VGRGQRLPADAESLECRPDRGRLVEDLLSVLDSGSAQEYLAILDRRDRLIASWDRFFASCDVFVAPAMPMRAWRADDEPADDSPRMQAFLALELSQASGCPMVVIPAGTDSNGIPFGLQVMGPRWADERLLAIAEAISAVAGGFQPPRGF
jgi:amidase